MTPHLDHPSVVHGDTVLWVSGQLEERLRRGSVHGLVRRLQVPYERRDCVRLAEGNPVVSPHAAASDGLGQVSSQFVISLG